MAKKEALRELQSRLAERMQAARTQARPSSWLAVECGGQGLLFPLAQAGEIFSLVPLVPVPHTQEWFAGVANLRGGLHGVVDLSAFLDIKRPPLPEAVRLELLDRRDTPVTLGGGLLASGGGGGKPLALPNSAAASFRSTDKRGGADFTAEDEAVRVFAANLRDLLLAAPAGAQTVSHHKKHLWHYWIAPVLAGSGVIMVLALAFGYYWRVVRGK